MEIFEQHRAHLFAVAYRMLGGVAEAEDAVQETYLRWREHQGEVRAPRAFLTTVVTRICLDDLRSARRRREEYIGPWLPEPVSLEADPEGEAELSESLSLGFLLLLQKLSPPERAVFLLREVFAYDYAEIASMVGKSEDNCRQLLRRARIGIDSARDRFRADPAQRRLWTERFLQACQSGGMEELLELLAQDVILYSDGGGKVNAARLPIYGADRVARFFLGIRSKHGNSMQARAGLVNGQPALTLLHPPGILWLDTNDSGILAIHVLMNPDKLTLLRRQTDG